ncbi:MAG TPA: helix-hairpin-helix domain-containing protein [Candidatus Fournierella merdigallinarum]|nr:helix-hairpin-helix domain-containing protein [Candidatus Fournierella merdigallinarum]
MKKAAMAAACCAGALVVLLGGYWCFAPFWQPEYRPVSPDAFSTGEIFQLELNSADADQLQTLPGLGPAKARAILEYREEFTRFYVVEQLILVEGITQQDLALWQDYLYIDDSVQGGD